MKSKPLISIIVPVYKAERYLDKCISSIVNQTYPNLEIILVDDGSPDRCGAMCDAWAEKDCRIRVVHKANEGVSEARNTGIDIATGKWLLFIDSDDTIPSCFASSLVAASKTQEYLVASGMIRFATEEPKCEITGNSFPIYDKNMANARGGHYCYGALYSRELVNSIGLRFDKSIHNLEDTVWEGIYLRYISEAIYVDVPYYYRINPTSITSKCGDSKWQIACWVAARRSIMNWFENKQLTAKQEKEVRGMFRHCQNNIFAECVAGKISYPVLRDLEQQDTARFNQQFVLLPERFLINHMPKLYFGLYTCLIRIKNRISKMRKS